MGGFLSKHKTVLMLGGAVVLVLAMTAATLLSGGRASPLTNVWNAVFAPVESGFSKLGQWMGLQYEKQYNYERLLEENRQLRIEMAKMEEQVRNSVQALEENDRLRRLIGLKERYEHYDFVMADVIERSVANLQSTLKIRKGADDGLEVGMCVITEENYLVGLIAELGSDWALINTVIDTDMSIGAIASRTGEMGVASGQFNAMLKGLLQMTYLSPDTAININDVVLTSGASGMHPPGIVIGTVAGLYADDGGLGAYAEIKPRAPVNTLTQVFVITAFEIEH